MIRPARPDETESLIKIWLDASLIAHSFISPAFWREQTDAMRHHYLPSARNWVYVADDTGELLGFISLLNRTGRMGRPACLAGPGGGLSSFFRGKENYIAALFVSPRRQREGIGSRLLAAAMAARPSLELSVYVENAGAVAFYRRHGFRVMQTGRDEATGQPEYRMVYSGPGSRIAGEKRVVGVMIRLYCRKKEHNPALCPDCAALLAYAEARLDRCPFGEGKTSCQRCKVHCYRPAMREKMKAVMRFSGPRMLLYAPWVALRHFFRR